MIDVTKGPRAVVSGTERWRHAFLGLFLPSSRILASVSVALFHRIGPCSSHLGEALGKREKVGGKGPHTREVPDSPLWAETRPAKQSPQPETIKSPQLELVYSWNGEYAEPRVV